MRLQQELQDNVTEINSKLRVQSSKINFESTRLGCHG